MNCKNENQHYVSRVLLKRFKTKGSALQCYQVQTRKWIERSIESACSAEGYNQLLLADGVNNAIENSFSSVESTLPKTFKALEEAANQPSTELPKKFYENMCLYCAFLIQTSLFSKPAAVVSLLDQINTELEKGSYHLLHELKVPNDTIMRFRQEYFQGGRIIIESENVLQLVHRLQFDRLFKMSYAEFLNCDWTVSHSPVELPMSDIGLVPMQLKDDFKGNLYLLPISPKLMLEGLFNFDLTQNSSKQIVSGHNLTAEEAEYRLDTVCSSAVREIIFSRREPKVQAVLDRAKTKGITFNKVVNPELAISAGLKGSGTNYSLQMVSLEEYVKFVQSFVQAPILPENESASTPG